ncbi:threonine ammonia-lyase [Campylobacter mucosalis]|uniref:Threonine deaminase n=1 Tax=Campylobacter mucosalis CCUG 21559 TaxID=1032067 RepID=A0A6G5QIB3_9BACT|nr:threonine ammonia-lyase [Campylobacter mucosalis]QCD45236.1 threonine deaminase [Campylobacter mucosalis CCUG 21559]
MVLLNKIIQAKRTISGFVDRTPFAFSSKLSTLSGAKIYLKEENLQRTGAYKIRGAYNKIANLSDDERKKGVVAASAGNHAQGVAISAREFGIKAVIVMPESTPLLKVANTRALGAEILLKGDNFDEAYEFAINYAKEHSMSFIHPFNDEFVMAGQGTIGLEMLDEVADLDIVIIPVGGGGLASGISSCVKQVNPDVKVVCVGAKGAPAMFESFKAKKSINSKSVRTIADGIAVRDASETTLANIIECVDEFVQVDDEEIANAILFLLESQKIVVEGAGAAGVAALMHGKIKHKKDAKIGIVLSGGNIDVQMLSIIIEKGLIKSARKMIIQVTLIDKPGALLALTDTLKTANANIVKIDYDRFSTELEYGDASIIITLETKGKDHQELVATLLNQNGFEFKQIF